MSRVIATVSCLIGLCVGLAPAAWSQGRSDYANYESVQVRPIRVARVDGHDYLLVVNTPDNSVEIYDTVGNVFQMRIPVGQGPVSIAWRGKLKRFYTANFLGDSISVVELDASTGTLQATFVDTVAVPDEPWSIGFYTRDLEVQQLPGGGNPMTTGSNQQEVPVPATQETLIVTHMTPDLYGWYDAGTLAPVMPGSDQLHAEVPLDLDGDGIDDTALSLKEPRALGVLGDELVITATKGGNSAYDNDIYCRNLKTDAVRQHGLLGTTHLNQRLDAAAGHLYVVGGMARNDLKDEPNVAAAPTGFFESRLYLVRDVCTDTFNVESRDLNLDPVTATPVAFGDALAAPTDLVLFKEGGVVTKVFVAAFSSDRIGVLQADFTITADQWAARRIANPPVAGNPMAGPRGLTLKRANASVPGDPGDRLYVLNGLDNSVTVIDPLTETVVPGASFALQNDPRPAWVRLGQEFLFGAHHSGNGFTSCSSCHIDARGDRIAWDLGTPDLGPVPLPATLLDGPDDTEWPADKGDMVTQSLQGLINWEVEQAAQRIYTNAPYHWRADRNDLDDFNPAFVGLLGRASELTDDEMAAFKEYVFSIHYPPNPKQGLDREFTGDFGPLDQADDMTVGTGAQHGLKLYVMANTDGRTCVHCHALPEGSNNLITEGNVGQPIEVAALRHIFQREARVDKGRATLPSDAPFSGLTGLTHTGFIGSPFDAAPFNEIDVNAVATIDAFNRVFFAGRADICGVVGGFCQNLQDLNAFNHEFDTGTAPIVGLTVTLDSGTDPGFTATMLDLMEGQVRTANAGLAVHAWIGNSLQGFWYDITGTTQGYRTEPFSSTVLSRSALLGLLVAGGDRLVVHATPLGDERRIASPTGVASTLPAAVPGSAVALPWRANDAYDTVPLMTTNWTGLGTDFYVHMVQVLQHALLQEVGTPAFGLPFLRHEAPRRAVVAGRSFQHGARLEVFFPNDPSGPPNLALAPRAAGQISTIRAALPIYPTDETDEEGRQIWETAVELAPLNLYKAMVGGDGAPGVQALLNDTTLSISEPPPPGMFDPLGWGWVYYQVRNPGGSLAVIGWQRLTLF